MTCTKGPQVGIERRATAAMTHPLYMGHPRCQLSYHFKNEMKHFIIKTWQFLTTCNRQLFKNRENLGLYSVNFL